MLFWSLVKRLLIVLVILIAVDIIQPRLAIPIFPLLLIVSAFFLLISYLDGALGGKARQAQAFTANVFTVGVASFLAILIYNKWPEARAQGWISVAVNSAKLKLKKGGAPSGDYLVPALKDPNYKSGEVKVSELKEPQSNYKVVDNAPKNEKPVADGEIKSSGLFGPSHISFDDKSGSEKEPARGDLVKAPPSAETAPTKDSDKDIAKAIPTIEASKDSEKATEVSKESDADKKTTETTATKESDDDKIPPGVIITEADAKLAALETNQDAATKPTGKSIDEAAATGDVDRINELLKSSGEGDEHSDDVNKRLVSAVSKGNIDKINELIKAGANPNHVGPNKKPAYFLFRAANSSNADRVIEVLVKAGAKVNLQTENGLTALFLNTKMNRYDAVKVLLASKADPNLRAGDGTTAIFSAVIEDRTAILELLLTNGAKSSIAHNDGTTPLMMAVIKSNQRAVEILLQHGADAKVRDKKGLNAKDYARAWSNEHINTMLTSGVQSSSATPSTGTTPAWYW